MKGVVAHMKYQIINHQHIFESELPQFRQCHASTLCMFPDGNFAAAWFGGDYEKASNVAIWFSRRVGGEWSYPVKIADKENVPCWNPVLMALEDRLVLFYKVGNEIPDWQTFVKESFDFGETWSEERELVPGDFGGRGPVKNKCIFLKDGTILAPASTEKGRFACFVDISKDGGKTWERSENVPADWEDFYGTGMIQPSLWQDKDGLVHMLIRSSEGAIFRSDSEDGGRTWSLAKRTLLPNNNCGIDLDCMEDGRLVLVYNPVSGNWAPRSPIAFAISEDNGDTWSEPQILEHTPCERNEQAAEYSYPSVITKANDIYFTYTWKRRTIAFWQIRLPERKVLEREKSELWPVLPAFFDKSGILDTKTLMAVVKKTMENHCAGLFVGISPDERENLTEAQRREVVNMVLKEMGSYQKITGNRIPVAAMGNRKGTLEEQLKEIGRMTETGVDITVLFVDYLVEAIEEENRLRETLQKILESYPEQKFGLCEGRVTISAELVGWCAQTGHFVFLLDGSEDDLPFAEKLSAIRNSGTADEMKLLVQNPGMFLRAMRLGAHGFGGMQILCFPLLYDWMRKYWNDDREQADQMQNLLTMMSVSRVINRPTAMKYLLAKRMYLPTEVMAGEDLSRAEIYAAEATEQYVNTLFEEVYGRIKTVLN